MQVVELSIFRCAFIIFCSSTKIWLLSKTCSSIVMWYLLSDERTDNCAGLSIAIGHGRTAGFWHLRIGSPTGRSWVVLRFLFWPESAPSCAASGNVARLSDMQDRLESELRVGLVRCWGSSNWPLLTFGSRAGEISVYAWQELRKQLRESNGICAFKPGGKLWIRGWRCVSKY